MKPCVSSVISISFAINFVGAASFHGFDSEFVCLKENRVLNLVDWQYLQVLKFLITGSRQIDIIKPKLAALLDFSSSTCSSLKYARYAFFSPSIVAVASLRFTQSILPLSGVFRRIACFCRVSASLKRRTFLFLEMLSL